MYVDENGEVMHIVAGAVVGGVISGGVSLVSQAISGQGVNWKQVGISAATGAVIGAATAALPGGGTAVAYGATKTATTAVGTKVVTNTLSKTVTSLINNADKLKKTKTVMNNISTRPYINSTTTIKNIMKSASPKKDPGTANGLKWVVNGTFNGSKGVYELVIDPDTMTILHFLFKSVK